MKSGQQRVFIQCVWRCKFVSEPCLDWSSSSCVLLFAGIWRTQAYQAIWFQIWEDWRTSSTCKNCITRWNHCKHHGLHSRTPIFLWLFSELLNVPISFRRLYGNNLTGPIPESLGNLTNLEGLELQKNALSGAIPSSLGNIKTLQFLYVIVLN